MKIIGAQLDSSERAAIDARIEADIAAAFEFAENSPFPQGQDLFTHVYAE